MWLNSGIILSVFTACRIFVLSQLSRFMMVVCWGISIPTTGLNWAVQLYLNVWYHFLPQSLHLQRPSIVDKYFQAALTYPLSTQPGQPRKSLEMWQNHAFGNAPFCSSLLKRMKILGEVWPIIRKGSYVILFVLNTCFFIDKRCFTKFMTLFGTKSNKKDEDFTEFYYIIWFYVTCMLSH